MLALSRSQKLPHPGEDAQVMASPLAQNCMIEAWFNTVRIKGFVLVFRSWSCWCRGTESSRS